MNPIDPSDPSGLDGGGQYVTVGGLPAIFVDGGNTLDWSLPMPEQEIGRYSIHVEIKGPGADLMRAQVMALVASIQFDPPVPVLNPADGPRFAAAALAQVRAQDPAFACFPDVPGTTATATVTQLPMLAKLNKPLPVACGMEIQPTSDGRWKITLVESWTAASDRSAGSMTVIQWLAADGTLAGQNGESFPTDIPYSN
jgi:hypothetical protein